MGVLTRYLQQKQIIVDRWLLDALRFFQIRRNELVHEGKTTDIEKAIDIGQTVLIQLKNIQDNLNTNQRD